MAYLKSLPILFVPAENQTMDYKISLFKQDKHLQMKRELSKYRRGYKLHISKTVFL